MTITDITNEAQSLIASDNVPGSLEFAEKLEKSLFDNNIREANPNAYRELSKIIFQLYVTAIPNLEDKLLFNIISFNLIEALNPIWPSERDLASRIESKYSIYPIELIKEMMRKDLLSLVEKNNQQIGNIPLRLSQDNPQAKPTIANWIEYYNRATGMNSADNFAKSKFISGDTVVQTLSPAEREALRKVLSFYDYLQTDETVLYQDIYNESNHTEYANIQSPAPIINSTPPTSLPVPPATQANNTANPEPISSPPTTPQSPAQNGIANNIPQFSPKPIATKAPVLPKSSAPIVLTAKPAPIPKNLVNLKQNESNHTGYANIQSTAPIINSTPLIPPTSLPVPPATQANNTANPEPISSPPTTPQSPAQNGIANNIPQFSPKPIATKAPVLPKSSAPIVLTAKPAPIPKNLVNLKQPE